MATLQSNISRRVGDKSYLKYFIIIPLDLVEARGWAKGQEIDFRIVGKTGVLLQPATKVKVDGHPKFEEFAEKVEKVLQDTPEGMPWGRIRELTDLPQLKPSAFWVKRMAEEKGLIRVYDSKTSRFIWRLSPKKGLEKWIPVSSQEPLTEVKYSKGRQITSI